MSRLLKRLVPAVVASVLVVACTPPSATSYPVPFGPPIASTLVGDTWSVSQVMCNVGLPPTTSPEGPFVDVRTSLHTRVTFAIDGVPVGTVTTFPDQMHSGDYERAPSPRVPSGSCLSILIEDYTGTGPFVAVLAWYDIIV